MYDRARLDIYDRSGVVILQLSMKATTCSNFLGRVGSSFTRRCGRPTSIRMNGVPFQQCDACRRSKLRRKTKSNAGLKRLREVKSEDIRKWLGVGKTPIVKKAKLSDEPGYIAITRANTNK